MYRNKLWITGGQDDSVNSHILDSTEYILPNGKSIPGPNLPIKLTGHSMVNINYTHTIILAGRRLLPPSRNVSKYGLETC